MGFRKGKNQSVENSITDIPVSVIAVTEDNLRVILMKHIERLGKKKDLASYIALDITLLTVLLTANFTHILLSPDSWFGVCLAVTAMAIWKTIVVFRENKEIDKCASVDGLIIEIRKSKSHVSYGGFVSSDKINARIDAITKDKPGEKINSETDPMVSTDN